MSEILRIPSKRFFQNTITTILFLILLPLPSHSQNKNINSHASLAEKIYLQFDRKVYTTDNTIWFKSIVTNAIDHTPTIYSGVLYVELIGPDEMILERKLIKVVNGIGDGFFQLSQNYPEGLYLIRAYTRWNKNFNTDFFFKEYIHVFDSSSEENADPISNITIVERQNNERSLTAHINPFAIDSLHKNNLTLFITLNNKKDSLTIKKSRNDEYLIDYVIPDECQFVTLQIRTKNLYSYTKTIAVNKDYLDLQFFPESGELVHGLQSKIGFKALDYSGKGKTIEGKIVNGQDEVLTTFKSNKLGMGSFILSTVDSSTTYFARLASQSEEGLASMYPLPGVTSIGNVLSVDKKGDEIYFYASSNYLKDDSIYVRASCRGQVYYDIKGRLEEGVLRFSLQANKLPEGVIAFTMVDSSLQPVAERLYFNERPETRIKIDLSTDKDTYTQRELTILNIETSNNDGEAVNANLSLLVLNKKQLGQIQNTRQNILSYFLLSSDLKGKIENSGFYFSKANTSHTNLDALLLTQGWRKYLYTKPMDKILFEPETTLTVSGSVDAEISHKKKRGVELTMMTFGNSRSIQSQKTDSLGRFNFNANDEYGQNINILIQSTKKSGKKKDYTITLNNKESPPISFDHVKSVQVVDSVVNGFVEKNIERKIIEDNFQISKGTILLDEIVVEGYKITPTREKVMEKYGKPDLVISGKSIEEKEEQWSLGLYSVLKFNFSEQVSIQTYYGRMYARVYGSLGPTIVVVDGVPVKANEYHLIPYIPPSEVSSFEIIKDAKNFTKLYHEVLSYYSIYIKSVYVPSDGSVIAIYTYGGNGIHGIEKTVGMLKANVPVFSPPREFYEPRYEILQRSDWFRPDLRALVHWDPKIMVDSLGIVSTTFYNADNIGEMQVVVEAISENGEIGYKEIVYEVEKRK